jgi:mannobiose 2-epimerase
MLKVKDDERGGFFGYLGDDGKADPAAPKGAVLNARILWTFSAALRRFGEPALLAMAERAFEVVVGRFWDETEGGLYWMLDAGGRPLEDRKQTYALAFGIYALAEYAHATGLSSALDRAQALYRSIEKHAADRRGGGYWEARSRNWRPLEDVRLSAKDENAPKSMNTHLHVLEAYATLLRLWDDPGLRDRLRALLSLFADRVVDPDTGHLRLFFDESFAAVGGGISYGHDIEASWLLVEAAGVLGDEESLRSIRRLARRMATVTLDEGFDRKNGGLFAERHPDTRLDDDKHWWMQAEAVVGFLQAYELTREERFLAAAERTWRFIDAFLVDRVHGEWRWRVRRDGQIVPGLPKVEPWKCPYHNSRAAFEVMARVDRLLNLG